MEAKWLIAAACVGLAGQASQVQALITNADAGRTSSSGWEVVEPIVRDPVVTKPAPKLEVIREMCALPASGHTLYIPGVAKDIVNDLGDVTFIELSDGTAALAGTGYSKSWPEKKYEFFISFDDIEGEVQEDDVYFYHEMNGSIRSYGAGDYFEAGLSRRGGKFQIGFDANKKNDAYGAAGWFSYWGTKDGNGDINIKLVDCKTGKGPVKKPTEPEWVSVEVEAANGSSCPNGDVSISSGNSKTRIDLEIPMIQISADRFERESCQATVSVNRPAGWKFAIKQFDAWYNVDLAEGTKANITGSSYFQGSSSTQTFSTNLEGKLKKSGDIHLQADKLEFSDCDGSRALNLKTAANVRSGWGAVTVKSKQRYQIVWEKCH